MQLHFLAWGRVLQLRDVGRASARLESAEPLAVWYVCPRRSQPHFLRGSMLFPIRDQPWAPYQAVGPMDRSLLSLFPFQFLPLSGPQFPHLVTLGSSQCHFQLTPQGSMIEGLLITSTWLHSPSPERRHLSREGRRPSLTLFLWTHMSRLSRGRHGIISITLPRN